MEITQTQTVAWNNPPNVDGMAPSTVRRAPMPALASDAVRAAQPPCPSPAPAVCCEPQAAAQNAAPQSSGSIMAIFAAIISGLQQTLAHFGRPPALEPAPPQVTPGAGASSTASHLRAPE